MNREELIAFMKRVSPILHEPLATKVAEEWADKFVDEFEKPQGEPSDADVEAALLAYHQYELRAGFAWLDSAVENMRRALRAAGVVGQEGQGHAERTV